MNTQTAMPDLSPYDKACLIDIAKHIPTVYLGDYARKSKASIFELITSCDPGDVASAIAQCVEEDLFEEIEVEEDDDEQTKKALAILEQSERLANPAPQVASDPESFTQTVARINKDAVSSNAAERLAEALKAFVPAQQLDQDAVRQIVAGKIGEYSLSVDARFDEVEAAIAEAVAEAAGQLAPVVQTVYIRPDSSEHKVEGEAHASLDLIVKLASIRENILMVGPAGSGKTYLGHQAATVLGLEFGSISCTAGMSESQLLGWLLPIGEAGRFEYVESEFVRLYQNGGVFLLDEVDAADANTLMVLNQALANGGFYVPQARRWIKRHPDFVCIAAANTYGHGGDMVYAGREKLDGAFLDRFRTAIVDIAYDLKLEGKLIDADVLSWGLAIREKVASLKLRRVMSTRAMVGFTKQKQAFGWGTTEWEKSYFADWSRDELSKLGR